MAEQAGGRTDKRDPKDTWFEFFYDVILASALASMHDAFLKTFSVRTALITGTVAAMVFTVWFMSSLVFNRFPGRQPFRRVILIVQMAALVIVALAADYGGPVSIQLGVLAYATSLVTVAMLYWTAPGAREPSRGRGTQVLVVVLVAEAALVSFAVLLPSDLAWFILAATCGSAFLAFSLASSPRLDAAQPIDKAHLADRMGSFIVVVIGMGFAQLILDAEGEDGIQDWRFFALIFVVMFTLWWMYFNLTLNVPSFHDTFDRYLWIGSHYFILIGIVGMNDVLSALAADLQTSDPLASISFAGVMLALSLVGFAALAVMRGILTFRQGIALTGIALLVGASSVLSETYGASDLRMVAQIMVAVLVACAIAMELAARRSGAPVERQQLPFRMLDKP